MITRVLALLDRPDCDECAAAAVRLAKASAAELILAFDPHDRTLQAIEAEMSALVGSSLGAGVKTKTMLVHMDDADAVARAIKCNRVDVVVLPDPVSRSTHADRVAHVLTIEQIPMLPIALRSPAHA